MPNIINFNDLDALELFCLEKGANGITELLVKEIKARDGKIVELKAENKTLTDAVDQLILDSLGGV